MSQLTTHILDTTKGIPASNIPVRLFRLQDKEWLLFANGITNEDGRIPELLDEQFLLPHGLYKLRFETQQYFDRSFYPFVEIAFYVDSDTHYHVPLLLSPFGYSTYRGS